MFQRMMAPEALLFCTDSKRSVEPSDPLKLEVLKAVDLNSSRGIGKKLQTYGDMTFVPVKAEVPIPMKRLHVDEVWIVKELALEKVYLFVMSEYEMVIPKPVRKEVMAVWKLMAL